MRTGLFLILIVIHTVHPYSHVRLERRCAGLQVLSNSTGLGAVQSLE